MEFIHSPALFSGLQEVYTALLVEAASATPRAALIQRLRNCISVNTRLRRLVDGKHPS